MQVRPVSLNGHRDNDSPRQHRATHPPAVAQLLALQRSAGNRAVCQVVDAARSERQLQRKIAYRNNQYVTTRARGGWDSPAEAAMLAEYNAWAGTDLEKLNYKTEKLARAHVGAYERIQKYLAAFLNGDVTDSDFVGFVGAFTNALARDSDEYARIDASWGTLQAGLRRGYSEEIVVDANNLLNRLNNLTTNLRAADKYLNSYIGDLVDLVFEEKNGKYSLAPHARGLLKMGVRFWGEVPRTLGVASRS